MTGASPAESTASPPLRVRLAEAGPLFLASVEPWFEKARLEVYGRPGGEVLPASVIVERWSRDASSGIHRRLVEVNGRPIGLLAYSRAGASVVIHELATAPEHRDRSLGAEAVYALEAESGASTARALVPLTNGLAIYFWLRIGYRPTFFAQQQRSGFTVMVRDLLNAGGRTGA
jgi:hypothetical protein